MATLCSYCGKELPRGRARFCTHCGTPIPSHSLNVPASSAISHDVQPQQPPVTPPMVQEQNTQQTSHPINQSPMPVEKPSARPRKPGHAARLIQSSEQDPSQSAGTADPDPLAPVPTSKDAHQIDDMPTVFARLPSTPLPERELHVRIFREEEDIQTPPAMLNPRIPSQANSSDDVVAPTAPFSLAGQRTETPSVPQHPSASSLTRAQKRSPFVLIGILVVCVVLVLAIGSGIFIIPRMGVAASTMPLQTIHNTKFGVSVSYPSSWREIDSNTSLMLTDSSNTDQIQISRSATGTSIPDALKSQASHLGMTDGVVGASVTFGGCTWQQMSGSFQVQGAVFASTIYACSHNNQIYILTQTAPKPTYSEEEKIVFAPARTSLHLD
jgi:zinc-ribbon domain